MALTSFTHTFDRAHVPAAVASVTRTTAVAKTRRWQSGLPVFKGLRVHVRELRCSDAASLQRSLTTEEVTRFISPPPTTVDGFERFIDWTIRQRAAGDYVCFAIVPNGGEEAIGIIQVRRLDGAFATAEWGFAIAQRYWGTGMFLEAAELVLAFCFRSVGVRRLEARAATVNGRGNGALRKLGASCDGLLTRSFLREGRYFDQYLWSLLSDDWETSKAVWCRAH